MISVAATLLVVVAVRNLSSGERQIRHQIEPLYAVEDRGFAWVLGHLLGPPLCKGNEVRALHNGDEIFPAMLRAIREARRSITFETFIYWAGDIAREFAAALSARAQAGVKVHVLLDWLGSNKIDEEIVRGMEEAGVEVERYHPIRWYQLDRVNHRTHRKLLVVDGRIGFTGGVGIADEWRGQAQDPDHWRDVHYRVEGPVVAQMQAAFMDNWLKTRARVLHGEEYFPALEPAGGMLAQTFRSSPREGSGSVRLMYMLAIAAARREILIGNAYFVPDRLAERELVEAARRGVRIRVLIPGEHIDSRVVRWASRARWDRLLEAGIEIYEYEPTMYHCKIFVVDRLLVSVGSTNFDNRSFRLNDEANLNVLDADLAAEQAATLEADIAKARRYTLEDWQRRPWTQRLRERVGVMVRSQV